MSNNIMIVDDEVGAVTLLSIMLERKGFHVIKANSAEAALATLDKTVPDLIILDVMMPNIDGIELCGMLRERKDTATTPILILSARGDAESVARGMQAGANDYLPKPVIDYDIASKIRELID